MRGALIFVKCWLCFLLGMIGMALLTRYPMGDVSVLMVFVGAIVAGICTLGE